MLTRRQLLGGGLLLAGGWVLGHAVGHRPLGDGTGALGAGRTTLTQAFDALLPDDARPHAAELAGNVERFLFAQGDPVLTGQLRLALTVLEHAGGAGPFQFRRFSRLDVAARRRVFDSWMVARIGPQRQIADAVRKVVLFTWYTDPRSWDAIGYDGPWVGR